jgi:hypothetical protein
MVSAINGCSLDSNAEYNFHTELLDNMVNLQSKELSIIEELKSRDMVYKFMTQNPNST